VFKLQWIKR